MKILMKYSTQNYDVKHRELKIPLSNILLHMIKQVSIAVTYRFVFYRYLVETYADYGHL